MSPSPRFLMSLVVILSIGLGLVLVILTAIVVQLRRRLMLELTSALETLRKRVDALEASLSQKGTSKSATRSSKTHPGAPYRRAGTAPRRLDSAEPNVFSGPTLIAIPSLAAASSPSTEAVSNDLGQRFGPIWDLADTGASLDAIARATGQPIGQVELILALRRQLAANAGGGEPSLT